MHSSRLTVVSWGGAILQPHTHLRQNPCSNIMAATAMVRFLSTWGHTVCVLSGPCCFFVLSSYHKTGSLIYILTHGWYHYFFPCFAFAPRASMSTKTGWHFIQNIPCGTICGKKSNHTGWSYVSTNRHLRYKGAATCSHTKGRATLETGPFNLSMSLIWLKMSLQARPQRGSCCQNFHSQDFVGEEESWLWKVSTSTFFFFKDLTELKDVLLPWMSSKMPAKATLHPRLSGAQKADDERIYSYKVTTNTFFSCYSSLKPPFEDKGRSVLKAAIPYEPQLSCRIAENFTDRPWPSEQKPLPWQLQSNMHVRITSAYWYIKTHTKYQISTECVCRYIRSVYLIGWETTEAICSS